MVVRIEIIKKTFPHQTRLITRQCHPEDDGKNLTSSCVYQKPKALPWSDCVVSFQSAFEFSEKKKIGCRRLGSARKYFHWSPQAQTSLAQSSHTTRIMIIIIIFVSQHKTLPFFYTQGQASCAQVSRSCQGRGWIWQCGNKRFFS